MNYKSPAAYRHEEMLARQREETDRARAERDNAPENPTAEQFRALTLRQRTELKQRAPQRYRELERETRQRPGGHVPGRFTAEGDGDGTAE